jgi:LPXTG-motif cell wall-anchored protein
MHKQAAAALAGIVTVLVFGTAAPAFAVNYPPTTVHVTANAAPAPPRTDPHALPFTGGNSMTLVWIALALIAFGAFLVARKRRAVTG